MLSTFQEVIVQHLPPSSGKYTVIDHYRAILFRGSRLYTNFSMKMTSSFSLTNTLRLCPVLGLSIMGCILLNRAAVLCGGSESPLSHCGMSHHGHYERKSLTLWEREGTKTEHKRRTESAWAMQCALCISQEKKLCSSGVSNSLGWIEWQEWLSNWDKQVADKVGDNNKTNSQKARNQRTPLLDTLVTGDHSNKTLECMRLKSVWLTTASPTDTHHAAEIKRRCESIHTNNWQLSAANQTYPHEHR